MILSSPGAVAFDIFGFSVYWYGIIMAVAILLGTFVADFVWRKYYCVEQRDFLIDLMPRLVLVGFVGARAYYCLLNWAYYVSHPLSILNVREGGLSIHGAIFAGMMFLYFYCRKKGVRVWKLAAPLCVGLSLAQCIGRWGNFFNSEAFGRPYDGFIKLYIPQNLRPVEFAQVEYFHPTFLYESVLDLLIFGILFMVVRKKVAPKFVTGLYLCLYAVVRIAVEFLRIDSVAYAFGLPIAVIVSGVILLIGVAFFAFGGRQ